jgi:hypothetical protein
MTDRGVARNTHNVDFFTNTHRLTGQVEVGGPGLVGLLNDALTSLCTIRNVYVSRITDPAKIIGHFDETTLVKANIALGLVSRREDLGPQGFFRPGSGKILSAQILVTTMVFEVQATIEYISRIDPDAILVGGQSGASRFTAMYNVTVSAVPYANVAPFTANAMFINRGHITGMHVSKGK